MGCVRVHVTLDHTRLGSWQSFSPHLDLPGDLAGLLMGGSAQILRAGDHLEVGLG